MPVRPMAVGLGRITAGRRASMSGYVALRLPLPGVVVTWFVTGFRATSPTGRSLLGPSEPEICHDMVPQRMSVWVPGTPSRPLTWPLRRVSWRICSPTSPGNAVPLDPPGYQLRVHPGTPPLPSSRRRQRSSLRFIIRACLVWPSWRFVPSAVVVPALERSASHLRTAGGERGVHLVQLLHRTGCRPSSEPAAWRLVAGDVRRVPLDHQDLADAAWQSPWCPRSGPPSSCHVRPSTAAPVSAANFAAGTSPCSAQQPRPSG